MRQCNQCILLAVSRTSKVGYISLIWTINSMQYDCFWNVPLCLHLQNQTTYAEIMSGQQDSHVTPVISQSMSPSKNMV